MIAGHLDVLYVVINPCIVFGTTSQCSTVVRNAVVRAVQKCIGKRRFWAPVAP